jgi:hypothetical protein
MAIFHHQFIDTRQISCPFRNPQIVNNDADARLHAAIIGDILSVFMIMPVQKRFCRSAGAWGSLSK